MDNSFTIYVGTYTVPADHCPKANGQGLYVYSLRTDKTELESKHLETATLTSPSFLTVTKNKKFLFTASESLELEESRIHAFALDGAKLRHVDSQPIGGVGAAHITTDSDDKFVFISNYNGGSIAAFAIADTGHVRQTNFYQFKQFSGVVADRQEAPHLHSCAIDGQNRYLYALDLGNDCLWKFNFSSKTGFTGEPDGQILPAGSGPRHAVFHSKLPVLYVACELSNHLFVCRQSDDGEGRLEQMQYISTIEADYEGPASVADLQITGDNRFLYVSTRFHDSIAAFTVHSDGRVSLIDRFRCGGQVPRNLALVDSIHLLFVSNQSSNRISVFNVDNKSGKLEQRPETIQIPFPVCAKIVKNTC